MDKEKDVNKEETNLSEESTEEESITEEESQETVGDNVKKSTEEESEETQEVSDEEILQDGTEISKKTVPYKRFQEVNEKAQKLDDYQDVIEAIEKDPTLKDKILGENQKKESTEVDLDEKIRTHLGPMVKELERLKSQEIVNSLKEKMSIYPDFKKHWSKIKTLVPALEAAGNSYSDALDIAYLAAKRKEFLKPQETSDEGKTTTTASTKSNAEEVIDPQAEEIARITGISVERLKELQPRIKDTLPTQYEQ